MVTYTQGNLLEARVEALVNTVNTDGVMGKGIALMFKERFDPNFRLYAAACKAKQVRTGRMFVTETGELDGPKWVINFPTKQHWRAPSRVEWIVEGLQDLKRVLLEKGIKSVAIPPLGAGNGGLDWPTVRARIQEALGDLPGVDVIVFEPTDKYQNVAKRAGVEKLTPARALIAELVRRYWVLGMECSLLEIQKLAWFLERTIERLGTANDLKLEFAANKYGPYANRLQHLLNSLDGSYLHCEKRIADASPFDVIWFDDDRKELVQAYLRSEAKDHLQALEATAALIDGFESPYGMELLATVDWLLTRDAIEPTVGAVREGLSRWPAPGAGERKSRLFDDRSIAIALERLQNSPLHHNA
jgi:O-acetyl-ADP-ribose deacetylase (regulator of RNase III)